MRLGPLRLGLVPRVDEGGRWGPLTASVAAVLLALLLGAVTLALAGLSPVAAYAAIARAGFLGGIASLADTATQATPLLLTGLACALAFRAGLWNIGAEGQLLLGAWAATGVASFWSGPHPAWLTLSLMAAAGILAGAGWAAVPGLLRARLGTSEILSSLMLTYVAAQWNNYWIYSPWSDRGFQMTPVFPPSAWLPTFAELTGSAALRGTQAHLGLLVAALAAVAVWVVVARTRLGYELRLMGASRETAAYAGVPVARNTVLVLALSGALAGLAGVVEVAGVVHRLQERFSPGYGFTGVLIAWLGRLHPAGVALAAFLFGGLLVGAKEVQPAGVAAMLQGEVLLCLIGCEALRRWRPVLRWATEPRGGGT